MDNYLTEVLSDPLIAALTVPLLFLLAGGFGKKLVRGANDWHRKDFYLGVNATLATMSATLIYLFDITKSITESNAAQNTEKLIASGVFLAIWFFLFMFILGIHHTYPAKSENWESKNNHRAGQWFWLVIGSNAIGLGLMSFFILATLAWRVIKGV